MRKNHNIFWILTFIVCSLLLSACGGEASVPDKYIDYAVQDFLNSKYSPAEKGYESYKVSTSHNLNKSAHTDEVNATLRIIYPCGEVIFQGNQRYQYSKSDDNWSEMDFWHWDETSRTIDTKSITRTWTGGYYELDIETVNFDAGTVTCKYSISSTEGSPWTKGGTSEVTYTGHDTFSLKEALGGDYRFIIDEADESFYVELSVERGVSLGRWG